MREEYFVMIDMCNLTPVFHVTLGGLGSFLL